MPDEIFTIGHSTHEAPAFRRLLDRHRIEAVADIRRYPSSRRWPQFNADSLAAELEQAGIAYLTLGEQLGGRRKPRPDSPNAGWSVAGFRAYADHMASPEFAAGLARLEELARERPTAFMCAEGDWRRCHRRLVSDALLVRGWSVVHIGRDGGAEPHALTELAVIAEHEPPPPASSITYPPAQTRLT